MRIANPIYDVVFKYLMEDLVIAKDLLSAILSVEILSLEIKPQEQPVNISGGISVMRIDFKAKTRLADGTVHVILVEIQKTKRHYNILRFRRYLANNYKQTELAIDALGNPKEVCLPVTAIYFLGYKLDNIEVPILKVARRYKDAITGEKIDLKEDFVEQLSHDLYAIQIPRLKMEVQTELENMLDLFSQVKYKTGENHVLEYTGDTKNPKVMRMLKRLKSVFFDDEVLRAIEAEEEIEGEIEMINKENEMLRKEREQAIFELEKTKRAKDEATKAKDEATKAKDEAIIEFEKVRKANDQALSEVEHLKKQLAEALKLK
jgi:hypothetical protein